MRLSAATAREWIADKIPHRQTKSADRTGELPQPLDMREFVRSASARNQMIPLGEGGKQEGSIPVWSLGVLEPNQFAMFGLEGDAELKKDEVRVATLYTGWSAGTEGAILTGNDARGNEDLDKVAGLFRPKKEQSDPPYPRPIIGYMEVGVVVDSKRKGVNVGEIVCGTWGHKTGHTYKADEKTFIELPSEIEPIVGILVAQMGPICANGLAHADRALRFEMTDSQIAKRQLRRGLIQILGKKDRPGKELAGRNAVVFGAGIVGLVTAMMAKSAGANVAIVDMDQGRLARAEKLGLMPIDISDPSFDLGAYVKDELGWKTKRGKPGADVAFQCTAQSAALHSAMRCVGRQQPVIDLGYYTSGAKDVHFGKEFHHFGLLHICAQVENLLSDWPKDKLREFTVDFLKETGAAIKEHVISDDVAFAEAGEFISSLRDRPSSFQVAMHP
jgi:hypothetical protein